MGDKESTKVVLRFLDQRKTPIQEHFKKGAFKNGNVASVQKLGQELEKHFPTGT